MHYVVYFSLCSGTVREDNIITASNREACLQLCGLSAELSCDISTLLLESNVQYEKVGKVAYLALWSILRPCPA